MSAVRAVIRALVLQQGWDEVNEILQSERLTREKRKESFASMSEKLKKIANRPPTDLERARARAALRKLGKL